MDCFNFKNWTDKLSRSPKIFIFFFLELLKPSTLNPQLIHVSH
jgi:hypothetical protein